MNEQSTQLIYCILRKSKEKHNKGIGITRLIKYVYLVDLYYYRKKQSTFTNIDWIYFKFGPYSDEFLEIEKDSHIEISEYNNIRLFSMHDYSNLQNNLDVEVNGIIDKILKKFSGTELDDLLDYVYYDTEPMIHAKNRLEKLDFSCVKSEEYYNVKKITPLDEKQKSKAIKKIKNKLQAKKYG